jgi:transcriptional regulator with XRE-family HTH domain
LPFCHLTLKGLKPISPVYPKALKRFGNHLRKKRLDLGLLQKEVAQKLGADKTSIHNWERGHATPSLDFMPRILKFLGYNPFEKEAASFGEKIKTYRRTLGLSQKTLAKRLGIDPTTLARWEREKGRPSKELLEKVDWLFASFSQGQSHQCEGHRVS